MRKNDAFVAKIANMRLTKTFVAIFTLAEGLLTSATLIGPQFSNGFEIRLRHKIHLFPVSSSAK